jgi:hypothetical protein
MRLGLRSRLVVIIGLSLLPVDGASQRAEPHEDQVAPLARACGEGGLEACRKLVTSDFLPDALRLAEVGPPALVRGLASASTSHEQAITFLRIATRRFPRDATFSFALGRRILDAGQVVAPTDAEAYGPLVDSVRAKPNQVDALLELGWLELRRNRPEDAEPRFRAALRADADSALAHAALGGALLQLGRPRQAATEFRRALQLATDDRHVSSNASIGLAEAQFWLGNGPAAIESAHDAARHGSSGQANLSCTSAVTLWWMGRDDAAREACQLAVEGNLYCNCQGRTASASTPPMRMTPREAAVIKAALMQSQDAAVHVSSVVIVEATTAFSDIQLPPVAAFTGRFNDLAKQYQDSARVVGAIDDLLLRSRTPAVVDVSGGTRVRLQGLSRRDMREIVRGVGQSFYQRFPSAHGFVTVSRPGFSPDGGVAAVAVQRNRDLWNGPVDLYVLDHTDRGWALRANAETRR